MEQWLQMSESEERVMQVLWEAGEPLPSARIIEHLQGETGWKPSTVWTFLGRLVDKGLLRADRRGKANYYVPVMNQEEYRAHRARQFISAEYGGSLTSFFAALSGGEGLNRQDLDELRAWLRERGEE